MLFIRQSSIYVHKYVLGIAFLWRVYICFYVVLKPTTVIISCVFLIIFKIVDIYGIKTLSLLLHFFNISGIDARYCV